MKAALAHSALRSNVRFSNRPFGVLSTNSLADYPIFGPRLCEISEIELADRKFVSILSTGKINTLVNTVGRSQ
jgi:hypothetical protein